MISRYSPIADLKHETYEFLSSGSKGTIKKVVHYTEIRPGIYNLGFGDWDENKGRVRDDIRSNNADGNFVNLDSKHSDMSTVEVRKQKKQNSVAVVRKMKDYSKEPVFRKKAAKAAAFLEKHDVPPSPNKRKK